MAVSYTHLMAMKILNQFIDDFVGVFQYRFMDTFQYFKERKKSKYLDTPQFDALINNLFDIDLGKLPEKFTYKGKEYTPQSFTESLGLNMDDYVELTLSLIHICLLMEVCWREFLLLYYLHRKTNSNL